MMKKFLISFLLLAANLLYSQTLEVTGDTVVYGSINDFGINDYLIVKNIGTDTSIVVCAKNVISQPLTGSNDFCWGGTCYLSHIIVSLQLDTLAPGEESQPGAAGFKGSFHPGIPGPATPSVAVIEYCFYPQSNTLDQTCITVTYNAMEPSSTNNLDVLDKIGSFYPNPTNEYTNLRYNVKGISVNKKI